MAEDVLPSTVHFKTWTLTTDHTASNDGQLVLVDCASALGKGGYDAGKVLRPLS